MERNERAIKRLRLWIFSTVTDKGGGSKKDLAPA